MQLLRRAGMDDVVEQWLRAEFDSPRFGARLDELLERDGLTRAAVLADPAARLRLLAEFRSQEVTPIAGAVYVDGLPISEIEWWWAVASRDDLAHVLYIDWDYWLEVTDGSRRPADFVARLRVEGGQPIEELDAVAVEIRNGRTFRPMILVDSGPSTRIVVAEGHFRVTAHLVAEADAVEVLFGRSPLVADWTDY